MYSMQRDFYLFVYESSTGSLVHLQLKEWFHPSKEASSYSSSFSQRHIYMLEPHGAHAMTHLTSTHTIFMYQRLLNKVHPVMQYHLMGLLIIMIRHRNFVTGPGPSTQSGWRTWQKTEYKHLDVLEFPGCAGLPFPVRTWSPRRRIHSLYLQVHLEKFGKCLFFKWNLTH